MHRVISRDLKNGRVQSCGCLRNETTGKRFRKHGMRKSKFYAAWAAMKARCTSDDSYVARYYKNRDITYCPE